MRGDSSGKLGSGDSDRTERTRAIRPWWSIGMLIGHSTDSDFVGSSSCSGVAEWLKMVRKKLEAKLKTFPNNAVDVKIPYVPLCFRARCFFRL